ncbi:zinc-binding alcohol dehydrogenase family protein [Sphingopyxis sp. JAI108]|uniref:quinone oxidoreductase family protein n=1 Tax=Sphingopyxis sp. JAI108 TaxID=2723060 RepID=UPI0015C75169|nr:zinc-binding alcohol dehydrogenase family protein [Sphingopyxis sp. JAI108]NYF30619.1 NADPH:quinone reductase-like Zn-dependent oxidoreductase [Sphingopyxis sp. JAI108]
MKAAIYDHEGPPEVLHLVDAPDPDVAPGEVLIRVEAISIEGGDLISRHSTPPRAPGHILGYAAAGTVLAVGDDVMDRKVGDRVTSWNLEGSHAELRAVPWRQTWLLPPDVGVAQAAAIPIGFGTAHYCLFTRGGLSKPSSVLVQGAAGGVGIAAVQLARAAGANVIAVARGEDRAKKLAELGASRIIDPSVEPVAAAVREVTGERGVDLVIDPVGSTLATSLDVLRDEGTLVAVGNAGGASLTADLWPAVQRNQSIHGVFMGPLLTRPVVRDAVDTMLADLSKNRLVVPIDRRFPLSEAAAAHRYAENERVFGRIILIP